MTKKREKRTDVQEHFEDKETKLHFFGEGEWINEPDEVIWIYRGIQCEIKRNSVGAWCGYCEVPKGHPFDQPLETKEFFGIECTHILGYKDFEIDVYGGLTFTARNEKDIAIIGFDCCHVQDLVPILVKSRSFGKQALKEKFPDSPEIPEDSLMGQILNPTYKNMNFAMCETENMVDQMLSYKKKKTNEKEEKTPNF